MNIVLVEPQIPQNTGNIARSCAGTNTTLHLVHPLGFSLSEKNLKRAGLDYWDKVKIVEWPSLADFLQANKDKPLFFLTTKTTKFYSEVNYPEEAYLLFGKETKGLPEDLIFSDQGTALTIPMCKDNVRSLNLATSAGIVLYEALRQNGFCAL